MDSMACKSFGALCFWVFMLKLERCRDLDFEYPANSAQGQGLADLVTALRTAFNSLASRKGDSTSYLVTAAVAAGSANYANYVIPQMNSALSYWNLMVCLLSHMVSLKALKALTL
jgi:hypothetical protein